MKIIKAKINKFQGKKNKNKAKLKTSHEDVS